MADNQGNMNVEEIQNVKAEIDAVCGEIQGLSAEASIGKYLVKTGNLYQRLLILKYLQENPPQIKEVVKYVERPVEAIETQAEPPQSEPDNQPSEPSPVYGKLKFDLNDRLAFQRRLFNGNAQALMTAVDEINQLPANKALTWADDLGKKLDLDPEDEVFARFRNIIETAKS